MVATHARRHNPGCLPLTLTTEVGIVGGFPAGGLRFGAAHNAVAALPCASMLDFYNGGGADMACLGMAEVPAPPTPPPRLLIAHQVISAQFPA